MVVGSHVSKLYDGMKNECRPLDVTLSNGSISYRVKTFALSLDFAQGGLLQG